LAEDLDQLAAEPIFLGGHFRSGTTWLYDLMTTHELVAGAFETWMFSPLHGIGGVFAAEQWDGDQISDTTTRVGRAYGLHQFGSRDAIAADVRELLEKWMARNLGPDHRFLVEKTPTHLLGMETISEVFPKSRFVQIVRDGRDVAVSMHAAAKGWNPRFGDLTDPLFRKQAISWKRTVRGISAGGAALGDRYFELRYEDLHRDPVAVLSQTFEFCGIPSDASTVEEIVAANRFSGHRSGRDAFRRKGEVGDWRNHFNLFRAFVFNHYAGGMLASKGYEDRRRWWLRAALTRPHRGS
jgi:hypothetical protein